VEGKMVQVSNVAEGKWKAFRKVKEGNGVQKSYATEGKYKGLR